MCGHSGLYCYSLPEISFVTTSPDPIISYIVGPCTCTETMALNGYINICILWLEFSNWSPLYSLG